MTIRGIAGALILSVVAGCGGSATSSTTTVDGAAGPSSIDGVWLLEGTELVLDIVEDTATVDARSDCARVLGSLTFGPGGDPTSFSLPGRDISRCSPAQADRVDRAVTLLERAASVEAAAGGYRLLDRDGDPLGFLTPGD